MPLILIPYYFRYYSRKYIFFCILLLFMLSDIEPVWYLLALCPSLYAGFLIFSILGNNSNTLCKSGSHLATHYTICPLLIFSLPLLYTPPTFTGSQLVPTRVNNPYTALPACLLLHVLSMALFCHNESVLGRPCNNLIVSHYNYLLISNASVIVLLNTSLSTL